MSLKFEIGKFLQPSGIADALVAAGLFGRGVVESSVLKGGDYVKSREAYSVIAETILFLQFEEFKSSELYLENSHLFETYWIVEDFKAVGRVIFKPKDGNKTLFVNNWEKAKESLEEVSKAFKKFRSSSEANENYAYWNIFIDDLFSVLTDFELSVRRGEWEEFVVQCRRCVPIFFAKGRTHYSRYSPLFVEDCLDLQRTFPDVYRHFVDGGFVCYLSEKQASGIGFDMGLEKVYNFDAKASSGIIGFTRQKEAVALWDLLKHDKDLYVVFMKEMVALQDERESLSSELNSLHHEFSERQADKSMERVNQLITHMQRIGNPFSRTASQKLHNITTKEELSRFDVDCLLNTIETDEERYKAFKTERLEEKSVSLHAKISHKYVSKNPEISKDVKKKKIVLTSDDTENAQAARYIQYAASRGIQLEYILSYPLLSRPVFLLEKHQLYLKKSSKGDLSRALLSCIHKDRIEVGDDGALPTTKSNALMIDFMSVVRRISSVDLKAIKTFGEFCNLLLKVCSRYGFHHNEVHLIMENYKSDSPKSSERKRRAEKIGNLCDVTSDSQAIPENIDQFFTRTENKKRLLSFFVSYCKRNYTGDKPLYVAGGQAEDPTTCLKLSGGNESSLDEFRASHEEADDRIMLSIHQVYLQNNKSVSVTVLTPDTDILVSLLYHLNNEWNGLNLFLMKNSSALKVPGKKQWEVFPLLDVVSHFGDPVISQLPAGHALTGCDTVAKVGTKAAMLKTLMSEEDDHMLLDFGRDRLDNDMLALAEKFLIKVISKKHSSCDTFNQLRHKMFLRLDKKKLTELPCSSDEIRENIKRANLQTKTWMSSPFIDVSQFTDPTDHGFSYDEGSSLLIPTLSTVASKPADVPEPCSNCRTCVKVTCRCRQAGVACSDFCSCSEGTGCKNPHDS